MFLHPTSPACAERVALGYPCPLIEFPFETTRAITQLILTNTLERCPHLRLMVPHAGGTLPFLVDRISGISLRLPGADTRDPRGAAVYLRRLYYDLAGSTSPAGIRELAAARDRSPLLRPDDRTRVCQQNALDLFPRLRQVAVP